MKPPFGIPSIMGVINSRCVKELSKLNQWLINSGYVKELPKRTRNNNPTINSGCVKELYPNLLVMTIPVHCCVSQFPVDEPERIKWGMVARRGGR